MITKKATEDEIVIKKFSSFLEKINIKYDKISHYILAFIHKSIVNERPDYTPEHNERLEFLGDAVLELIVTSNLYNDFPKKTEGVLTDIRSALVRGKNLAKVGKKLGISDYLFLGKGEDKGGGRKNNYLLANTIEALIGAIYLDLGQREARKFIETHIYSTLDDILKENKIKDYKTIIQEFIQAKFDETPKYKLVEEKGFDHEKIFVIGIFFCGKIQALGEGSSKKKAQEKAAEIAYKTAVANY